MTRTGFVCVYGGEICGLAFSWDTNIPSTDIAIMPQLEWALSQQQLSG